MMALLGSVEHPVIVRVPNSNRAQQVVQICKEYGFHYIMGLEAPEDLTDLKKAIRQHRTPESVYDPCPCGSGSKFKFCCAKKPIVLEIN